LAAGAGILLLPLAAMQVTDEVSWTLGDFAAAGALIVGVGALYELAARTTGDAAYRGGVAVALAAAFLLVWMNLAVGLIGTEEDPANLLYGGVLAVAAVGALVARLRPRGMARALAATALAQALVGAVAVIAGMGQPASPPLELVGVNALFVALWLTSALLFRWAARRQARAGA
jgi:hypothetical protein